MPAQILVTTTADSGAGSLREAIIQSNASVGVVDQIYFNIAGGIQTITLQSVLPKITDQVTIDGYDQGDLITPANSASPNTLGTGKGTNANLSVQITAASSVVSVGLDVAASGTVIRGLSIYGFSAVGIVTESGATGVTVTGNFIGVRANGDVPANKNLIGVGILPGSTGNIIGGTANADRNLISGNSQAGIQLLGNGNTIVNNLIGTDKLGSGNAGNGTQGIFVKSNANTIGGTVVAARNVISGNGTHGVDVLGDNNVQVSGNMVLGNRIGTSANGLLAVGNGMAGVLVNDADTTTISGNLIAGNNTTNNASIGGIAIGIGIPGASTNTLITGNTVGLAADGTVLGNNVAGILIANSNSATVGGTTVAARNIIA